MYYSDVIIGATHYSFITTEAVEYALKKVQDFFLFRCIQMTTALYFEREFIRMSPKVAKRRGRPLAEEITKADKVLVKTKKGTNVAFSITGRKAGIFAGKLYKKRKSGFFKL